MSAAVSNQARGAGEERAPARNILALGAHKKCKRHAKRLGAIYRLEGTLNAVDLSYDIYSVYAALSAAFFLAAAQAFGTMSLI